MTHAFKEYGGFCELQPTSIDESVAPPPLFLHIKACS